MVSKKTPILPEGQKVAPSEWGELVQEGTGLLERGWWEPELAAESDWFAWGGASAEIMLPPFLLGTKMELDFMPAKGPAPLEVAVNGKRVLQIDGAAIRKRYWLPEDLLVAAGKNTLSFTRAQGYVPSAADPRALGVQFFGVRVVGPGVAWAGRLASEEDRKRVWVRASGILGPEVFPSGHGAWTNPQARLWFPIGPGTLTLTVWAPRPKPPLVELVARDKRLLGPVEVGGDPATLQVQVGAAHVAKGGLDLELRATPFCPAKEGVSSDSRELGVVIAHARFIPAAATG
jgi:hypothetical protein